MEPLLSSNSYAFQPRQAKGGLTQVHLGASHTQIALERALQVAPYGKDYFLWIADEGVLHAEAVHHLGVLPLSHLLLIHAPDAVEVWRTGLEAVQTGLFASIFLRASRPCQTAHLRKLQLVAQKMRCEVFLLTASPLPHWTLKETLGEFRHAHSVFKKPATSFRSGRELLRSHS